MLTPETIETTYADLRPTDRIVAKDGTVWSIADLIQPMIIDSKPCYTAFWLCDPATGVRMHSMTKLVTDPVTVERIPTHAEELAKAEAEMPGEKLAQAMNRPIDNEILGFNKGGQLPHAEDAVMTKINEELGAAIVAEVTAEEVDEAREAQATGTPVEILAFEEMTPLEQTSHLYLLHGVFAHDLQSRDELKATHDKAHADHAAGKLNSIQISHIHKEPKS